MKIVMWKGSNHDKVCQKSSSKNIKLQKQSLFNIKLKKILKTYLNYILKP
jgi:hypothetical protein